MFEWGRKTLFEVPPEEQDKYIKKLGEAKDDWDRSFKQYCCIEFFSNWQRSLLLNLLAIILILVYIPYSFVKYFYNKRIQHRKVDAIGEFKGITEIIPVSLSKEYEINNDYWFAGSELSPFDLCFVLKLSIKYFFYPYFTFKNIAKVARYSYSISHFSPKAIIVHDEYSFTSSLLTDYCERKNVKHINVMHGEKFYTIGTGYFRFHKCYAWGDHYVKLFIDLYADKKQFVIELPPSLKINAKMHFDRNYFADFKYYLQNYTEEQLKTIINCMEILKKGGFSILYRPHPRASNMSLLKKYVSESEIENPRDVNIETSISNTHHVISGFSTVMNQAYYAGIDILFDDITYNEIFLNLKRYRYILSEKKLLPFSSIVNYYKNEI